MRKIYLLLLLTAIYSLTVTGEEKLSTSLPEGRRSYAIPELFPQQDESHHLLFKETPGRSFSEWESSIRSQTGNGFFFERFGSFLIISDLEDSCQRNHTGDILTSCAQALINQYFDTINKKKIAVYAFRDFESLKNNIRRIWGESPISPYGHYDYRHRCIVFNHSTGLGTMVHELTHALMDLDMPQAPIWVAEGMASLYEECELSGNKIRGLTNWRLTELQQNIRSGTHRNLRELFSMNDQDFSEKEESLNYAMARYFCLYLEEKGLLEQFYTRFRNNFSQDPTGAAFIEDLLNQPLEKIEQQYLEWARQLQPWQPPQQ